MLQKKVVFESYYQDKVNINILFYLLLTDKLDEEVIQDGVKVFIDKKAQLSLLGKICYLLYYYYRFYISIRI